MSDRMKVLLERIVFGAFIAANIAAILASISQPLVAIAIMASSTVFWLMFVGKLGRPPQGRTHDLLLMFSIMVGLPAASLGPGVLLFELGLIPERVFYQLSLVIGLPISICGVFALVFHKNEPLQTNHRPPLIRMLRWFRRVLRRRERNYGRDHLDLASAAAAA